MKGRTKMYRSPTRGPWHLAAVLSLLTAPALAQLPPPQDLAHVGWTDQADQTCPVFSWSYPDASATDDLEFFWESSESGGEIGWLLHGTAVPGHAKRSLKGEARQFLSHGPCATAGGDLVGASRFIRLRACRGIDAPPCNPRLVKEKASAASNSIEVSYDRSPEAPALEVRRISRRTARLKWTLDGSGVERGVNEKPPATRFRVKARLEGEKRFSTVSTVDRYRSGMVIRRLRPGLWHFRVDALNSWGEARSNKVRLRIEKK